MNNRYLAYALAVVFAACSSSPPKQSETESRSPATGIAPDGLLRSLTFDEALALSKGAAFAPFASIAANRQTQGRDLAYLGLELLNSGGSVLSRATMTFDPLANNLEYISHVVAASESTGRLEEAYISIYGITHIVTWNSRKRDAGILSSSKPDQVAVSEGSVFPPSDQFALRQRMSGGDDVRIECTLVDVVSAATVHRGLGGQAKSFLCRFDEGDIFAKYWYLADAQRYIASEIHSRGSLQSRFRITAVGYRQ